MEKIQKSIVYCFSIICIFVFTFCVAKLNNTRELQTIQTNGTLENIDSLSNKKIGWGIKRNDNHEQPDVGKINKQILDKYEGYSIGNKDSKNVYLTFDEGYEARIYGKNFRSIKTKQCKSNFLYNSALC